MPPRSVPVDTSPEVHALLVERWRSMPVAERAERVARLCADVEALALAGIRATRPWLSAIETRHELARRRYGGKLADEAYRHLLDR